MAENPNQDFKLEELLLNAENGDPIAQCKLGIHYEKVSKGIVSQAEAAKWYREAAEQGHADAQARLGWCYLSGLGVREDAAIAFSWFHKAALQNDSNAQYNLAVCYRDGTGVIQNSIEAQKWFEKAAALGVSRARYWLAVTAFQSEDFAVVYAALRGGNGTTTLKSQTAFSYANKAAEQSLPVAQYLLGEFYRLGYGIKKCDQSALKWYSEAASNGYQPAQWRVTAEWLMNHTPISPDEAEDDEEYASQLDSLHKPALQHADREWIVKRLLGDIHALRASIFTGENPRLAELKLAMFWYENAATHGDKEAAFLLRRLKSDYFPSRGSIIYQKALIGLGGIAGVIIGIVIAILMLLLLISIFDGSGPSHYEDPWNEEPMLSPR